MITERDMTLGMDWDGQNVVGWYVSEKLDGCRAYWDGERLWSRSGKILPAPADFLRQLPAGFSLDGEIYCGRGMFQAASNAVRYGGKHWTGDVQFVVFDAADAEGSWPWRLAEASRVVGEQTSVRMIAISGVVESHAQLNLLLVDVLAKGGEGLMLRHPDVEGYERARTDKLLKVKRWPA